MFIKILRIIVLSSFGISILGPIPQARAFSTEMNLPQPGMMVNLSPAYEPALIKGLTVHKDNPFLFDFIVDTGHSGIAGDALKKEGDRLVKYFFACLTIPEKDLWVNLSPYEKNRMLPNVLGQTALGRDLLAQDYILKQLTASLIYPERDLGKEFWDRVYAKARQMYGTTQIPVNTFNKVWIVADKASVYEHGQTAFVVSGHLKVMLEEDYLALQKHSVASFLVSRNDTHSIGANIVKQIILPEIEKEVNTGKNFATLHQIFNSLILASWYKNNLKEALLNQVYADKNKINGVIASEAKQSGEQIYQQYLKAYKKGVFNYIKEDTQPDGQTIPRKYFSGGFVNQLKIDAASLSQAEQSISPTGNDYAMDVVLNIKGNTRQRPDAASVAGKIEKGPIYIPLLNNRASLWTSPNNQVHLTASHTGEFHVFNKDKEDILEFDGRHVDKMALSPDSRYLILITYPHSGYESDHYGEKRLIDYLEKVVIYDLQDPKSQRALFSTSIGSDILYITPDYMIVGGAYYRFKDKQAADFGKAEFIIPSSGKWAIAKYTGELALFDLSKDIVYDSSRDLVFARIKISDVKITEFSPNQRYFWVSDGRESKVLDLITGRIRILRHLRAISSVQFKNDEIASISESNGSESDVIVREYFAKILVPGSFKTSFLDYKKDEIDIFRDDFLKFINPIRSSIQRGIDVLLHSNDQEVFLLNEMAYRMKNLPYRSFQGDSGYVIYTFEYKEAALEELSRMENELRDAAMQSTHQARFESLKSKKIVAVAYDVDGNLTSPGKEKKIAPQAMEMIYHQLNMGVPVMLISGRQYDPPAADRQQGATALIDVQRDFMTYLRDTKQMTEEEMDVLLKRLYWASENGALVSNGFIRGTAKSIIYDDLFLGPEYAKDLFLAKLEDNRGAVEKVLANFREKLAPDVKVIFRKERSFCLIMDHDQEKIKRIAVLIRAELNKEGLSQAGIDVTTTEWTVEISLFEISKGIVVPFFNNVVGVQEDHNHIIVTSGDNGQPGGNDNRMLAREGGLSSQYYDPNDPHMVALTEISGQAPGVDSTVWAMQELFKDQPLPANNAQIAKQAPDPAMIIPGLNPEIVTPANFEDLIGKHKEGQTRDAGFVDITLWSNTKGVSLEIMTLDLKTLMEISLGKVDWDQVIKFLFLPGEWPDDRVRRDSQLGAFLFDFFSVYRNLSSEPTLRKSQEESILKSLQSALRATDRAMFTTRVSSKNVQQSYGGIDLNTSSMGMAVIKDAQGGVKVNFDPAMIARIRRQGIQAAVPVIISVHVMSMADIRPLLGFDDGSPIRNT